VDADTGTDEQEPRGVVMAEKSARDLIFEVLCLRHRAETKVSSWITRGELQAATGLRALALTDELRDLVGLNAEQAMVEFVDNDPDKIAMGPAWTKRCRAETDPR